MAVALAGAEHRRGEAGMVGAVGEVLGFERQRSAAAVGFAALADQGAVEEITAVELDARFGRPNLHITPRSGFIDRSRQLQVMGAVRNRHRGATRSVPDGGNPSACLRRASGGRWG